MVAAGFLALVSAAAVMAAGDDAPRYAGRRWTSNEGLPQNTVYSIVQQRDGALVVGTEEGAAWFDGTAFHRIATDWLEHDRRRYVRSLLEDRAGNLWIGTLGDGIIHRRAGDAQEATQLLRGIGVRALLEDERGDVWIGTTQGLRHARQGRIAGTADGPRGQVRALALSGHQKLWAAAENGLFRFDDLRWKPAPGLEQETVTALARGAQGRVWLGTSAGALGWVDDAGQVTRVLPAQIPDGEVPALQEIHALLEDHLGNLWIGARAGLFLLQGGRLHRVPGPDGARIGEVLSLFEDREHGLWVGLESDGLLRLRRTAITVFGAEAGLRHENVLSVSGDETGALWVGTSGGGVARLQDGRLVESYTAESGLASDAISTLLSDGASGAWVSPILGGVQRISGKQVTRPPALEGLSRQLVYALLRDDRGRLWMGTHANGVYWLDGKSLWNLAGDPECGLPSSRVYALARSHGGGVWVGTRRGVALVRNGSVERVALTGLTVLSLHEDANGVLWVGTDSSGLHWLQGETHGSAKKSQGLFDNIVFQILEEDGGDGLWMSSNHGLFRASKRELFDLQQGRIGQLGVDSVTRDDGMERAEANGGRSPAGWKTPDGKLWFATVAGLVRVDPALYAATQSTRPPALKIDAALVDGALVHPSGPVTVPPGRGELELRYSATSLASREGIRYWYRLDGFNEDWIDAGEQTAAHYTNLAPGTYTFRVKAVRGRYWSPEVSTGALTLEPHFWQTAWFRLAVALGVGLLALGAYQVRARQWRAERMVLAERNRLAREIHDGLTQSLTGILIQLEAAVALWSDRPDGSRPHVERAREWARHSLAEARMAVSSLRRDVASVAALSTALRRCAEVLTEGTSVRAEVKIAGQGQLPPAVGAALLRIGQEAMTNAVRHGQPRLLSVDLQAQDGELRLAVKDDGRGFDASSAASVTSNGLRNMRERAETIAALCELHSAPGNGTEVSVLVPLGAKAKEPLRRS